MTLGLVALSSILFSFLSPSEAHARRFSRKRSSWDIAVGMRPMFHYNRAVTLTTPPDTVLSEVQLTWWASRRSFGIYAIGGKSVLLASTTAYGTGINLPFVDFRPFGRGTLRSVSFMLVGDLVFYSTEPPTGDQGYSAESFVGRYGLGMEMSFGREKVFLRGNGMVAHVSRNFFVAPTVMFGYRF